MSNIRFLPDEDCFYDALVEECSTPDDALRRMEREIRSLLAAKEKGRNQAANLARAQMIWGVREKLFGRTVA